MQHLIDIARRLDDAERQIAELRGHMHRPGSRAHSRLWVILPLTATLTYLGTTALHAQIGRGPTRVSAPFIVEGNNGPILTVKNSQDGQQNQVLLMSSGQHIGVAMLTNGTKGSVVVGDEPLAGDEDDNGFRASLAVDSQGNGNIELRDKSRKEIARIQKTENSQGLAIYRPGTNHVAVDALANDSVAKISVRGVDPEADASGIVDSDGASLVLVDTGGTTYASMTPGPNASQKSANGTSTEGRGLSIFNNQGAVAARTHADNKGNGYISVKSEDGSEALVGIKVGGGGSEIVLAGPDRTVGAQLTSTGPAGLFIFSPSGVPALELTSAERGGRFWLGDNANVGMVEAGVTEGGRGVVRAGPEAGGPVPLTGMPSAILGKK